MAAFPPNFVDCIVLDRLIWSLSSPGRAQGETGVGRVGGAERQILWRPRRQQATRGWGRGQSHKNGRRQGVQRGPRRGPVAISAQGRRRGWNHRRTSRIRSSLLSIVPTCPARPSVFSARGALSLVAFDSEGSSLTHALRFAILRAILFLATPPQRWPVGPLMALRSRGLHSLRLARSPSVAAPLRPPPGHQGRIPALRPPTACTEDRPVP
ncbi:MAG: hypothetical protein ACI8RZ_001372 [Myxococcota bacterium]